MLDLFGQLISRFIQLAEIKTENRREYFDRYVEPTYQLAEAVYRDYIALLRDLELHIKREKSLEAIVRFLETRRLECLPIRMKLRAIMEERKRWEPKNDFELGVWGLMYSSIGSFDVETRPLLGGDHVDSGHTILDVMNWIVLSGQQRVCPIRDELLRVVRKIESRLNLDWQLTVEGYARLQSLTIPKIKRSA